MMPSEEEKTQILEAQMSNPDIPLGSAENFLLTLGSVSDLEQRLRLWAFTLEYDTIESVTAYSYNSRFCHHHRSSCNIVVVVVVVVVV